MALAYYHILSGGGFDSGGTNFDAKLRRQSISPDDLLLAHVGGMDCCARGFKAAVKMLEDGVLKEFVADRYDGWSDPYASKILQGQIELADIASGVETNNTNPKPVSGRQEYLENVVNRYV